MDVLGKGPNAVTTMRLRGRVPGASSLSVGIISPPWLSVPPRGYGGTETFVDLLARGLSAAGHHVKLFATGDSTCPVERGSLWDEPLAQMGAAPWELAHVRAAYDWLADCDVVQDNTVVGPVWAATLGRTPPVVTTVHGNLPPEVQPMYADLSRSAALVAISHDQRDSAPDVDFAAVIHHGLDASRFGFGRGDGGYVLWLGRFAPEKGAADAIEIARRAGVPLRIAAKMREPAELAYFREHVEPRLGPGVEFLGEIGTDERDAQLGGAMALLNPISWAEPFGLVMAESLACGTPVIAFRSGAAPEIVKDGVTGFLCDTVDEAVHRLGQVHLIDRRACRASVEGHLSARRMAAEYASLFRSLVWRAVRPSVDLREQQVLGRHSRPMGPA